MSEPFFLMIAAIIVPIFLVGAIYMLADWIITRKQRRDAKLTPLIGVVLPREEEK